MYKIGLNAKFYHNTGTYATPTWEEIDDTQEATVTLDAAVAELKARGLAWVLVKKGLKNGSVQVTLLSDGADTGFQALRDAFLTPDTLIDVFVADGDSATSGTQGLRAEMEVVSMEDGQPLEEGLTKQFSLRPGISSNAPTWKEVP